jgi:hypothetical protein
LELLQIILAPIFVFSGVMTATHTFTQTSSVYVDDNVIVITVMASPLCNTTTVFVTRDHLGYYAFTVSLCLDSNYTNTVQPR